VIGGWNHSTDGTRPPEPIDYETAVRDLFRRRRRRRIISRLGKLPDPRPTAPGQVVLAGLLLTLVGWLVPIAHGALLVGIGLLVLGFASGLIQPRGRSVVWRNRTIDLPPEPRSTDRLYYLIYRRPK
jgi:hypothetical protein